MTFELISTVTFILTKLKKGMFYWWQTWPTGMHFLIPMQTFVTNVNGIEVKWRMRLELLSPEHRPMAGRIQ